LAIKIENWYKLSRQQAYQQQQQQQYQLPYQQPYYQFNNTTAAAITSDASYAYRPSHDPRNFPHYTLNDLPPNYNNLPSPTSIHPTATTTDTTNLASLTQDFSSKLNITTNTTNNRNLIQLPTWTNNVFPKSAIIEPVQLAKWITIKESPPSILLIDIRTRYLFKGGCIKHQWIIQIDPSVLLHRE
jgi:hypothetical protein